MNKDKYYDGAMVKIEDVINDFNFESRNDYLKVSHYISKDGCYCASIYDDSLEVLIERTDDEIIGKHYYEVELGKESFNENKENEDNTSICIIAEHWPSIEEASIFCKKDMETLGYKYVIGITKLDKDEAKRFFDLSNEESWPILK